MELTIQAVFDSLPNRFKADKVGNYQGVFHFILTDGNNDNLHYTVSIFEGKCMVEKELHGEASCTVQSSVQTYLDAELGKINAQNAVLSGEIKIDNLIEMMNFSKFFKRFEFEKDKTLNLNELKNITSRKPTNGPLQGIKILDLTRLLPGPLATMLMADMGAEVIKIEAPNFYDYARDSPFMIGGESAPYLAYNRSKRSLALDYSSEEGKEVLLELVKQTDILMEQYRPGVMAKMGLAYEDLKKVNPQLVYVSITGYGQTGPYANLAGHDLNYITIGGLMSGNQYEAPQTPLIQIADIAGGSYMAIIGSLSALYSRMMTGKGQFVDIAMMDGAMPLAINAHMIHWAGGKLIPREESFLSGGLVNYGIYPCKEGKYVALGTLEAKFWEKFCDIIEKPEWKNRIFTKNREELMLFKKELSDIFMTQEQDYWVNLGLKYDLLLNAVYEIDEVENDPQVKSREMIVEMEHPTAGKIKGVGIPIKFSDTKAKPAWTPPKLGEDSLAILQEAGINENIIKQLIEKGILKVL